MTPQGDHLEEPAGRTDPSSPERVIEAEGESLGEAKWAAVKELEERFPGANADCVRFEVLAEPGPESQARIRAELDVDEWRRVADRVPEEPAERVRAVVRRVVQALGLRAVVDIEESEDEIRASVSGDELGLLIGKHGATIDALQHLAFRVAFRGGDARKQVTVDAAGYRDRREAALRRMADRAAAEALRFGRPVELEPMRPSERKIVHLYLRERSDVETHSEGDEPERRLVVTPLRHSPDR
jgi:spoIIIJ-associated protein